MKIYFAGIQLTDWANFPAQNLTVNGQTAFEAVDIVRALAKRFFSRGNDAITVQFGVAREFGTYREAQNYYLTVYSTLPKFGLCAIICGAPGDDDSVNVSMVNAVLTAMQGSLNGVRVTMQFTIQAGDATTDTPIDILPGGEAMILRGKEDIASGATSVPIVFDVSFPPGTSVALIASVAKPSGSGSNIFATVRDDLVTVDGGTVELSGPTPDANHKLPWIAFAL